MCCLLGTASTMFFAAVAMKMLRQHSNESKLETGNGSYVCLPKSGAKKKKKQRMCNASSVIPAPICQDGPDT